MPQPVERIPRRAAKPPESINEMVLLVGQSGRITGMHFAARHMKIAEICSICPATLSHSTGAGVAIHRSNVSGAKDE
jgi:hypothetical protein